MVNWKETINVGDVFHDEEMSLQDKCIKIIEKFEKSTWVQENQADEDNYLDNIGEWLEEFKWAYQQNDFNVDEFDNYWSHMYDLADRDRIWLKTWPK